MRRVLVDQSKAVCIPLSTTYRLCFSDATISAYTVKGNLCYGIRKIDLAKFDDIVSVLGIGHLLKRYPITLSGEETTCGDEVDTLTQPEILLMDDRLKR